MTEKAVNPARLDHDVYVANRGRFLPEDLLPYANEWVAWSLDGTRVVAHHQDLEQLAGMILGAGLDSEEVVLEFIPQGGDVDIL